MLKDVTYGKVSRVGVGCCGAMPAFSLEQD